jgi:hypothetical protein
MLYPLFAMVLLTLVVGIIALRSRVASVKSGKLDVRYFSNMQTREGTTVPERVVITTRCFNNQFEVPVLFYTASVAALALDQVSIYTLLLGWGFVISRCAHAWIHLTYNNVFHRMNAYWVGIVFMLALWIEQIVKSL